jgi:hypothetical protein
MPTTTFLGAGHVCSACILSVEKGTRMQEKVRALRKINIFYAWQSDLPHKFNRNAIKIALHTIASELEEEFSTKPLGPIKIVIDEATRDLPGSPHIPTAILEKIQAADVFVADVSTINNSETNEAKRTPNPNVVFELGYAVAYLGWERVLLLCNEVYGTLKTLPFDFDRQRASPFRLAEGTGSQNELVKLLRLAISLILDKNPLRPTPTRFDLIQTQRDRDTTNLRWFLESIHWPTLDEHIASGPQYLSMASAVFFDQANAIVSSSTFHLYDKKLKRAVLNFVRFWGESMKYDHYVPMKSKNAYIFKHGHPSQAATERADWNYMEAQRGKLRKAADSLLKIIREKFPEIDIKAMSDATAARYDAEMAEG